MLSYRRIAQGAEAAMKYFFFGFFSSILLIWGLVMSTLLGLTDAKLLAADTTCMLIKETTPFLHEDMPIFGMFFMISAFFVKIGIFPYHSWVI
jgi:NADH:ubiquinone oxidoreductase subunit 2 (subunit N)